METIMRLACAALSAVALSAQVQDTQTVTKRFPVSGVAPEVVVRIITGAIRVTAHGSNEVSLTANVRLEAPDAAALAQLKKDVRLQSEQSGDNVWIGVETAGYSGGGRAPRELGWRGKSDEGTKTRSQNRWSFRHDIELKVPRGAHLKLATVNGGDVVMEGVAGEFYLNNVNGGIQVRGARGSGRAHTVNGPVTIAYDTNPGGPLSVKTVNGKAQLSFARNLNADVQFKTFNGKVYSDFPMNARTANIEQSEHGMKRIWKAGPSGGRIGSGGPLIAVDTLNGDIQILETK